MEIKCGEIVFDDYDQALIDFWDDLVIEWNGCTLHKTISPLCGWRNAYAKTILTIVIFKSDHFLSRVVVLCKKSKPGRP